VLGVAVEDGEDVAAVVEGDDVMRAFFTADILKAKSPGSRATSPCTFFAPNSQVCPKLKIPEILG
jgi:hypothetical protein